MLLKRGRSAVEKEHYAGKYMRNLIPPGGAVIKPDELPSEYRAERKDKQHQVRKKGYFEAEDLFEEQRHESEGYALQGFRDDLGRFLVRGITADPADKAVHDARQVERDARSINGEFQSFFHNASSLRRRGKK